MPNLKLSWPNARIIKEQIEAAQEGATLGRTGQITTNSEYLVIWDDLYITLELPEDDLEIIGT